MQELENYITECVDMGITSHSKMCERAHEKILTLDSEIFTLDKQRIALKTERNNLTKILKALDPELAKRKKPKQIQSTIELSDNFMPEITSQICSIVESLSAVSPREIIQSIGLNEDDPTEVYSSIKWLLERGILSRNEDRTITMGVNWSERPNINA